LAKSLTFVSPDTRCMEGLFVYGVFHLTASGFVTWQGLLEEWLTSSAPGRLPSFIRFIPKNIHAQQQGHGTHAWQAIDCGSDLVSSCPIKSKVSHSV
jgi:hypothetical protein